MEEKPYVLVDGGKILDRQDLDAETVWALNYLYESGNLTRRWVPANLN